MFDKIKAYSFQTLALALGVLLLVQTGRLYTEQLAHEKLKNETAQAATVRAGAALSIERQAGAKESTHAQQTQENSDAFTTSQPVRDALHRADIDRAERLRRDTERRSATYRAMAKACAAASSGIADRLAAFDAQLVEGVAVVGDLRATVARRDAEVVLLRGQIDADRALMTPVAAPTAAP